MLLSILKNTGFKKICTESILKRLSEEYFNKNRLTFYDHYFNLDELLNKDELKKRIKDSLVFRLFRDYEDKVTVRMFLDDELETLKRNKHFSPIELEENSGEHEIRTIKTTIQTNLRNRRREQKARIQIHGFAAIPQRRS